MEPYQVETSDIQWAEEDKSKSTAEIFGDTPQMDATQPMGEKPRPTPDDIEAWAKREKVPFSQFFEKGSDPKKTWERLKEFPGEMLSMVSQAKAHVGEMPQEIKDKYGPWNVDPSAPERDAWKEPEQAAGEFIKWLPRTLLGLAKEPARFMEEHPGDVAMLLGGAGAGKAIQKIKGKKAPKPAAPEAPGFVEKRAKPRVTAEAGDIEGLKAEQVRLNVDLERLGDIKKSIKKDAVARFEKGETGVEGTKAQQISGIAKRMTVDVEGRTKIARDRVAEIKEQTKAAIKEKIEGGDIELKKVTEKPMPPGLKRPLESLSDAELLKRSKTASPHVKLYKKELARRGAVDEKYAGYPLGKELKESFKRLKGGVTEIPKADEVLAKRQKQVKVEREKPPKAKITKEDLSFDPEAHLPEHIVKRNKAVSNVSKEGAYSEFAKSQEVPGAEQGVVKYKEGGTQRVMVDEALSLMDKSKPDIPTKKGLIGATEVAFTPTAWWAPRHPLIKKLYRRLQTQDNAYGIEVKSHQKTFTKHYKDALHKAGLNPKKSADNIGRYAITKQKGGEARLRAAGKEPLTELHPAEMKVYEAWTKIGERYFRRINRARELAGQEPLKFEADYFTFMVDIQALESAGISLVTTPVGKLSAFLENLSMEGTKLPYAKSRTGVKYPVHTDFFNVVDKYVHDSAKHIHYAPVIAKGRAYLEPFDLPTGKFLKDGTPETTPWRLVNDKPNMAGQLDYWLNTIAGKSQLSKVPFIAEFQKAGAKLNRNIAGAVLAFNLRSALIQLSAARGAWVEANPLNTAKGFAQNFTSPAKRKFATRNSKVLSGRNMDIHVAKIINETTKGKISGLRKFFTEKGLSTLQFLDAETARGAWLSAYEKYKKLGNKKAFELADDMVTRTQASGKIFEVAPIQTTVGGRLVTLFQTFTTAEWNWMLRDVVGIKNPEANLGRSVVRTISFITATAVVNEIFEDFFDIPSPFPAPERAIYEGVKEGKSAKDIIGDVGGELLEAVPVVGSPIKYSQNWRTNVPGPAVQWTSDMIKVFNKVRNMDFDKITVYDKETLAKGLGLPGASQLRKYLSGRKRGKSHMDSLMGARGEKEETKKVGKVYW